ncbi:hypothetical protein C5C53_15340 [Rathayibacter sp. AY1E3]|uniref:TY-Chap2 family putative peptide chaperone n=1 Tax=Rathayibacter sp. AY1E3 TaxID=2080551 RepID=UPI000CE91E07|nr:hypothetical protein [Rathayibacter sp. AY1E3]PPH34525.1 hypothetical protein C5C53_15340 [Rathayibacter sp. AY1E3]
MAEFTPGDLGFVVAHLLGGPLDGTSYGDNAVFPDGLPGTSISVPLPDTDGLMATYQRKPEQAADGDWVYTFVGLENGLSAPPMAAPTEAYDEDEDMPVPDPAERFTHEQGWWIASELCRRHSRLSAFAAIFLDGHYHGPQVVDRLRPSSPGVFFNQKGRIHFLGLRPEVEPITWQEVLAAENPHEIVQRIEVTLGLGSSSADATTARSIGYRVVSGLLTRGLNDRRPWDVVFSIEDHLTHISPAPALQSFPNLPIPSGLRAEELGDRLRRILVMTRGGDPVLAVDEDGRAHLRTGEHVDLLTVYKRRRRLDDVLDEVMERLEP